MSAVSLRAVSFEDTDWIYWACQDPEIQRWTQVPRPYEHAHAEAFVGGESSEYAHWVVQTSENLQPVGMIGIHRIENAQASIGYWLSPEHRGRGFTTEAIGLVADELRVRRIRGEIEVDTMIANVAVENRASRAVVERAGFELSQMRDGPAVRDLVIVPTCVYTIEL